MIVSIVNVDVEIGKPGPKGWSKAVVDYMVDGQRRKQNLMSFTNPQVYKDVTSGKYNGEPVEVTITKNAKGYDEWAAISPANGATSSPNATVAGGTAATPTATRVTGSNYETAAERARRQVLIVKQSSLTAALKYCELTPEEGGPEIARVKAIAQELADWVFEEQELLNAASLEV